MTQIGLGSILSAATGEHAGLGELAGLDTAGKISRDRLFPKRPTNSEQASIPQIELGSALSQVTNGKPGSTLSEATNSDLAGLDSADRAGIGSVPND